MPGTNPYRVVKTPFTLRPWQVVSGGHTNFAVHGNYKTEAAAIAAAKKLNGKQKTVVIEKITDGFQHWKRR